MSGTFLINVSLIFLYTQQADKDEWVPFFSSALIIHIDADYFRLTWEGVAISPIPTLKFVSWVKNVKLTLSLFSHRAVKHERCDKILKLLFLSVQLRNAVKGPLALYGPPQ